MIKNYCSKQFLIFILTGGFAAAVNFVSRIYYNHTFDFSTSIILAYITGMVTAFILAKIFVFKDSQQSFTRSVLFFIAVNLIAVLQTWIISICMFNHVLPYLRIHSFTHEIAHAFGVAVPVFTSYFGHKRWSFRAESTA